MNTIREPNVRVQICADERSNSELAAPRARCRSPTSTTLTLYPKAAKRDVVPAASAESAPSAAVVPTAAKHA